jgi:hypothetical protein
MTISARQAARVVAQVESKGIYDIPTAAASLGERPATIRRWAFGYHRRGRAYAPAIQSHVPELDGARVLTFLELVELMFVQGLLKSGLSWPRVREALNTAARLLDNQHYPFATSRWLHDAAALYLRLGHAHGEPLLVDVAGHGAGGHGTRASPVSSAARVRRGGPCDALVSERSALADRAGSSAGIRHADHRTNRYTHRGDRGFAQEW